MRRTPSDGGDRGTTNSENGLLSIGEVLQRLREEFPEITISKIRFLEAEGLVEPRRTPAGYRKFRPEDVERLGWVLRMQRDRYLPLKVIREHLDALARGDEVRLPAPGRPREWLDEALDQDRDASTGACVGRSELLAAAEVEEDELAEWEAYGLISPSGEGTYGAEAVVVAKLLVDLGRFGLEPRHLRVMKAAADREADLVEQVVAPLRRHRNPQARNRAESTARELATLSVRLHAALVQSALRSRPH
jgi:DNA-binding transcriptional MerR regulator